MIDYQNKNLVNDSKQITESSQDYVNKLLLLSLIVAFLSIVIGFVISRNITNELNRAVIISENIAKGDFSVTSIKKDNNDSSEIGELINSLTTMANDLSSKEKELLIALAKRYYDIIEPLKKLNIELSFINIKHCYFVEHKTLPTYKLIKNYLKDKK